MSYKFAEVQKSHIKIPTSRGPSASQFSWKFPYKMSTALLAHLQNISTEPTFELTAKGFLPTKRLVQKH